MTAHAVQEIGDIALEIERLGENARAARQVLAQMPAAQKEHALIAAARRLRAHVDDILEANREDVAAAKARISPAMVDRLRLDAARIEDIAKSLEEVAHLADPVGTVMAAWERPNGLKISRVRVPLGTVAVIYESRPNVTADAGALCLKAGNAVILRGGSESARSARAIHRAMVEGLKEAGVPEGAIQLVGTQDRAAVGALLRRPDLIDVVVPRGGKSLIARVQEESRVPVLAHLEGLCHVYLDAAADPDKAVAIALNAKMRRTGICGAAETLLVDRSARDRLLPAAIEALAEAGCELRGDEEVQAIDERVRPAREEDWRTEYLDATLAIRTVDGVDGAIAHVARYGSGHTESIVTEDTAAAEKFLNEVDSAIVIHNASTQFADGGEFGMGAEIGISTGRLHARGPVGVEQLTTFKYVVRGTGQTRP